MAALEVLFQALPTFVVIVLQFGGFHGPARGPADEARLKHERHGAAQVLRFEFRVDGFFESFRVRAVAGHAVMQAGASGQEAFGLGVVFAVDQSHELIHKVAMEPGRAKCVLGNGPARRKDSEVAICGAVDF